MCGARWARFGRLRRRALQATMRPAGVLAVSNPLPRVFVRHDWPPDRRGGHRQRLRSRASGWPGPAPAPPRGARECRRSSAVVRRSARSFYSLLLSAAHEKAHKPRSAAIRLISALRGSKGAVLNEACASIGPHARHFARAADSASACSSGATAAQVVSPSNPQPRSSVALGAGFGRHGGGSRAHEPGPSRAMKTLREGSAQNRSRVARM